MAKRSQDSEELPGRRRLLLTMPLQEGIELIGKQIEAGRGLKTIEIRNDEALDRVHKAYTAWSYYTKDLLLQLVDGPDLADEFLRSTEVLIAWVGGRTPAFHERVADLRGNIDKKLAVLESVAERLELFAPRAPADDRSLRPQTGAGSRRVFVVHGHDVGVRESVARLLQELDLDPVILHEQASRGRTIVEKLEKYADVRFAVVLLTPDDEGRRKETEQLNPRARQNVILELGYFFAKLGRENVCALYVSGVELPSDVDGVVYVELNKGSGWKYELARELRDAGFEIDTNKIK